jgi:hypothetical protein
MAGMTGSVPYYGGRFTPAQAYAAAHPPPPPVPPPAAQPTARPARTPSRDAARDPVEALQHLLDSGVLTQQEFDELRERVER